MVTVTTKQSLLYFEDLTLPSFQVIVMTANMDCARCKGRVNQIISKLTGLKEYEVDVRNERVSLKADLGLNNKKNAKDDDDAAATTTTGSRVKIFSGCYGYALQFFVNVLKLFASPIFSRIQQKSK